MSEQQTQVSVRILDKDYQFACRPEERTALIRSADYLDRMMREIRSSGRVVGVDRIAVMAAMNMANELLAHQEAESGVAESAQERLRTLNERIGESLKQGGGFTLTGNGSDKGSH